MAQKKKLQVFISSTYTDLQEERQAAVQAILTARHIPAGMELFAAGDETQMNVIKHWIDESDVYMLILGGRYGSIEPKSGKSYTHLEYEYAIEKGKPLFAVVIDANHLEEKVKKHGTSVIEKDHSEKLKVFREFVCSKTVRFWSDPRDIKLAVMETMSEFNEREGLRGWIPSNEEIDSGIIAEEIAKLVKENSDLREQLSKVPSEASKYNGLAFEELYGLLEARKLSDMPVNYDSAHILRTANTLGEPELNLIHFLIAYKEAISRGRLIKTYESYELQLLQELEENGLVTTIDQGLPTRRIVFREAGTQFLLRLKIQKKLQ